MPRRPEARTVPSPLRSVNRSDGWNTYLRPSPCTVASQVNVHERLRPLRATGNPLGYMTPNGAGLGSAVLGTYVMRNAPRSPGDPSMSTVKVTTICTSLIVVGVSSSTATSGPAFHSLHPDPSQKVSHLSVVLVATTVVDVDDWVAPVLSDDAQAEDTETRTTRSRAGHVGLIAAVGS